MTDTFSSILALAKACVGPDIDVRFFKAHFQMTMKLSDYIFDSSWQFKHVNLTSYKKYLVLINIGDLKKGDIVKFIGYTGVDNHHGIFVFTDSAGGVLEVSGDFSHHASSEELKLALSEVMTPT